MKKLICLFEEFDYFSSLFSIKLVEDRFPDDRNLEWFEFEKREYPDNPRSWFGGTPKVIKAMDARNYASFDTLGMDESDDKFSGTFLDTNDQIMMLTFSGDDLVNRSLYVIERKLFQ